MIKTNNFELYPCDYDLIDYLNKQGYDGYIDKSTPNYNLYILTKNGYTDKFFCLHRFTKTPLRNAIHELDSWFNQNAVKGDG